MRFAEPWALVFVLIAPLSFVLFLALERRKTKQLERSMDLDLFADLSSLGEDRGRTVRLAQALLFSAGLGLVAISLARPQFGLRTEVRKGRGMDVVIAIDLSKSMLAQDVAPSRLDRARIEIADLVERLRGDRVGLVGFTSVAVPLCPLTTDHSALLLQLRSASPGDFPRGGTAVGDAIVAAKELLGSSPYKESGKSIVVITDGEEHEGDAEGAAKQAFEAGIEVHVVGVGSKTGEPIPLFTDKGRSAGYMKDANGQTVISRLDEELLRRVASAGNGIAALPSEQGGLDVSLVANHLSKLKRAELENRTIRVYEERFRWALAPALLLLVLATAIRPSKRRLARFTIGLAALCFTPSVSAGPLDREQADVAAGNAALAEGKAADAITAYEKARAALGDEPRLAFNKGLAEAARGELDQAVAEYQAAQKSTDPKVRAQAAFALGNAQRALKKYSEAMTAYREALLDDPSHTGAKRNLELVRAMERIQKLAPKNDQAPPKPDKNPPKNQDAGAGSDASGGGDGSTPDAKGENDESDEKQDAGGKNDDSEGDGGTDSDASSGGQGQPSPDAGTPPDAGGEEPEESKEEQKLDKKQLDQLLDALGDRERAAKRKKIQSMKPGKPQKDW
ncbi:MAG: VWA domain-containing protein [Deltaproteobacteria bacterium]|nr:VWA domain-containing protein [Deltaproteobacteria bacterium]